jgi:hypothetical protein
MPYKYERNETKRFSEADKADPNLDFIFGWEKNYVEAIKRNMSDDKILLIPLDFRVLSLLRKDSIPYLLCYPEREAKEEYHKRFIERGNSENFIDIFIGRWDNFLDSLESDSYGKHIVLDSDLFLSDVINVNALLKDEINEYKENN